MKIAAIHWFTRSVGGTATRMRTFQRAASMQGDTFHVLISRDNKQKPKLFPEKKWMFGGDTRIWVDGQAPHGENVSLTAKWLNDNYDAVFFSFMCPHPCKTCPEPVFLRLYEKLKIPMIATVPDGYWHKYSEWGEMCIPYLKRVVSPLPSYASNLSDVVNVTVLPFPFYPLIKRPPKRSETPLLSWTNQWKNIKGITEFLEIVPNLPEEVSVDLYSSGIRYYQLRTTDIWKNSVREDTFSQYHGNGRAVYYANVDLPEIAKVYCRSWFTCSLQGMKTNKQAYKTGSYNNAELEALYYGACPILYESALGAGIPEDCFIPVRDQTEIPSSVETSLETGYATCSERRKKSREFVMNKHWAPKLYSRLKDMFQ